MEVITGGVSFGFSKLKDLGNLTTIIGAVSFTNSELKNLGNLNNIGDYADFHHSKIQDLLKHYISLSNLYTKELEKSRYRGDTPKMPQYFTQLHNSSYSLLMLLIDFLRFGIDAKKIDEEIVIITGNAHKILDNLVDGFILFLVLYWTKSKAIDLKKYASELYTMYKGVLPALISVVGQQIDAATTMENDKLNITIDFIFY